MLGYIVDMATSYYGKLFLVNMGIQWAGWIFATSFKTEKFYDITGSATFIILAYSSYEWWSDRSWRQMVQSHMVIGWACRLGLYLFTRILKDGQDRRFDKAKESPLVFFVYWTIQGVWVFVTLLPTLMLNRNANTSRPLTLQDYLGWGIWTVGMVFEVVADFQKSAFRNEPTNKGKFINTGLWSISRHPNYFGEILLWFGLYISASAVFRGSQYLAVLSPIAVYILISRVSGVPLLEKSGLKKWGHLPEYQCYLRQTPELIPFVRT